MGVLNGNMPEIEMAMAYMEVLKNEHTELLTNKKWVLSPMVC
jgi:hypothetical protein